jgi:hypothetical protein
VSKTNNIVLTFDFDISAFLEPGDLQALLLSLRAFPSNESVLPFIILICSLQNISAKYQCKLPPPPASSEVLEHDLCANFHCPKCCQNQSYDADMLSQEYSNCPNGQLLRNYARLLQVTEESKLLKNTLRQCIGIVTIHQSLPNMHTVTRESSH